MENREDVDVIDTFFLGNRVFQLLNNLLWRIKNVQKK